MDLKNLGSVPGSWTYLKCNDRGQRDGECQICGAAIRYEHILQNEFGWLISIGCECADRVLSGKDIEYVQTEDKKMKSKAIKDAKNEILYQKYLARCAEWNEKYPETPCRIKTKEEIYG